MKKYSTRSDDKRHVFFFSTPSLCEDFPYLALLAGAEKVTAVTICSSAERSEDRGAVELCETEGFRKFITYYIFNPFPLRGLPLSRFTRRGRKGFYNRV